MGEAKTEGDRDRGQDLNGEVPGAHKERAIRARCPNGKNANGEGVFIPWSTHTEESDLDPRDAPSGPPGEELVDRVARLEAALEKLETLDDQRIDEIRKLAKENQRLREMIRKLTDGRNNGPDNQ